MSDEPCTMDILWDYAEGKHYRKTTIRRLMNKRCWTKLGAETLVDMVDKEEICREESDDVGAVNADAVQES